MLNSVIQFLLTILLKLMTIISNIITLPILMLLGTITDLNYSQFTQSFTTYAIKLCNGIVFAKQVFLNVTGFPPSLLSFIVTIWLFKITFWFAIRPVIFILRMWSFIKTGHSSSSPSTTSP